jgi:hypothetical protein
MKINFMELLLTGSLHYCEKERGLFSEIMHTHSMREFSKGMEGAQPELSNHNINNSPVALATMCRMAVNRRGLHCCTHKT